MKEVTGVLIDAKWDPNLKMVWGFIYGDIQSRFSNGDRIHTSEVMDTGRDTYPEYITTRNSYYKVEWA